MFSSWWSKGSGAFTCDLGAAIELPRDGGHVLGAGAFALHAGSQKSADKNPVSIFVCSETDGPTLAAAAGSVKKLKTLRHPSVILFVDAHESEKAVLLATEPVEPLLLHLQNQNSLQDSYLAWGILQVFRGVAFLHEAGLVHGSLHAGSVFVTRGWEWKLFGFEQMQQIQQLSSNTRNQWPALAKYAPPEAELSPASDIWGLGCIVWEVYNGQLSQANDLGRVGKIPKKLAPVYMELVAANPAKRPKPEDKIKSNPSFFRNDIVDVQLFLEEIQIKDDHEKTRFFTNLPAKLDNIPKEICVHKILPELIKAFDYSNAGSLILAPVFKIGKHLDSTEDYQAKIIPCIVKLFSSSDRNARFKLLTQIENFVEHLNGKTVNNEVFPQIQNGFLDKEPIIREKTVIAMIHLAPKLNCSNLDETVVMKHFSRLLRDEQPGIRTNTTVCLGKIARYLHYSTRQKVLISAFGGKLKDPFPPARIAAINALAATQQYYTIAETGGRVLPLLCPLLGDPEKPVREQTFKVVRGFLEKLEQVSENPELKEEMEREVTSTSSQVLTQAAGWASWAVGAIGAKFYKSSTKPLPPTTTTTTTGSSGSTGNSASGSRESTPADAANKTRNPLKLESKREGPSNDLISLENDEEGEDCWKDDDADWGALEDSFSTVNEEQNNTGSASADWDDFTSSRQQAQQPTKSDVVKSGIQTLDLNDWTDDWGGQTGSTASNLDDKKRQREEKRLQRQKELEAKRAAKKAAGGGPMKLASKKSDFPDFEPF